MTPVTHLNSFEQTEGVAPASEKSLDDLENFGVVQRLGTKWLKGSRRARRLMLGRLASAENTLSWASLRAGRPSVIQTLSNRKTRKYALREARAVVKDFYVPAAGYISLVLQFVFLPFLVDLPWEARFHQGGKQIASLAFLASLDAGWQSRFVVFCVACTLCCLSVLVSGTPQQKIMLAFSPNVHATLLLSSRMCNTVLTLPLLRILLAVFHCEGGQVFSNRSGMACHGPAHATTMVVGIVASLLLVVSVIHYISDRCNPLEAAKRRCRESKFNETTLYFPYALLGLKVVTAITLLLWTPQGNKVHIMLFLVLALLLTMAVFVSSQPYSSQNIACYVFASLCVCVWSNGIGVLVAINDDSSNTTLLIVLWGCGICGSFPMGIWLYNLLLCRKLFFLYQRARASKVLDLSALQDPRLAPFIRVLSWLSFDSDIERLILSGCWLHPLETKIFLASLICNSNSALQEIELSHQNWKGKEVGIELLPLRLPMLTTLTVDFTELGPLNTLRLCSALEGPASLTSLSMVACGLDAKDGAVLGRCLRRNSSLRSLVLANNDLRESGAVDLAKGMQHNCTLHSLDLTWNLIGEVGATKIVEACSGRARDISMKVRLTGNRVPRKALKELQQLLESAVRESDPQPSAVTALSDAETETLYALIGKTLAMDPDTALDALCERFYLLLVNDPQCMPFFGCVPMGRMQKLQKSFLAQALGGPKMYKGRDLQTAHRHLKITDEHYDAVVEHFFAALLHFIPHPPTFMVKQILDLLEGARSLVVTKGMSEARRSSLVFACTEEQFDSVFDRSQSNFRTLFPINQVKHLRRNLAI
ncbi:hypothetical protein CYMTET_24308 [Cymbomonas tetramitiformis]|uniref:Globin family profile domain-containing protein n=1 Tax=Cymbomonas tetramitiformis TaxID=36881 RepID=A0AAE0FW21_9CHLO|nr:hypothetical protein CYMTET_24308 [Cymbomonas tetramitiformis]